MKKLAKKHIIAINKLMIPLIKTVAYFSDTDNDLDYYNMLIKDIAHNTYALQAFNESFDVKALHNTIMQQDTLPRDHFYKVLQYIEDNELIPTQCFVC